MELKATVTAKGAVFDGKAPEIVAQALGGLMDEATLFLTRKVKSIILAEGRVGVFGTQGGLLSSVQSEVRGKGTPMIKGIVGSMSKYGDIIEKGRTAGKAWPPPGVLLRWIEVKLGVGEEEARRLEFVIRRKIGRKGFPGIHMFERAFTEGFPTLQSIFERGGFTLAEKLNG
jgi:hypothetical protein